MKNKIDEAIEYLELINSKKSDEIIELLTIMEYKLEEYGCTDYVAKPIIEFESKCEKCKYSNCSLFDYPCNSCISSSKDHDKFESR